MRFVETTVFTRRITEILSDENYRLLQQALLRRPEQGNLIEGTKGLRKIRWKEAGRGKRGSLRIIYFWHSGREMFLMLYVYRKNEQEDLTAKQKETLARAVHQEFQ